MKAYKKSSAIKNISGYSWVFWMDRVLSRQRSTLDADAALSASSSRSSLWDGSAAKSLIGQYGTCPRSHSSSTGSDQPITEPMDRILGSDWLKRGVREAVR